MAKAQRADGAPSGDGLVEQRFGLGRSELVQQLGAESGCGVFQNHEQLEQCSVVARIRRRNPRAPMASLQTGEQLLVSFSQFTRGQVSACRWKRPAAMVLSSSAWACAEVTGRLQQVGAESGCGV